jgi:hypothetical protein
MVMRVRSLRLLSSQEQADSDDDPELAAFLRRTLTAANDMLGNKPSEEPRPPAA